MKHIVTLMVLVVGVLGGVYFFLGRSEQSDVKTGSQVTGDRVQVVATFYPLQQLAAGVVGDMGEVNAVVPAGMEPHEYEPSIGDIKRIYAADLFLLNGAGMDAWAEKLMPDLESKGVPSLRLADKVILLKSEEGSGHEHGHEEAGAEHEDEHTTEGVEPVGMGSMVGDEHGDEHEHGEWDPHFWLDPISVKSLVLAISEALSQRFPEKRSQFEMNAEQTIQKLEALDIEYRTGLAACSKQEVVTSHDAFRYLAHRYGFETHALAGFSPEEEPSPKRLAELAALVKAEGIQYVFFETLVSPKMAETLARETGTETLVFNPIEGVTTEESATGVDYWSLMHDNLSALRKALECK